MANIIQKLEEEQLNKRIPPFKAGDTVAVQVKVREGNRERLQTFEGLVIAKSNKGLNSSFTVRKISHGEGVERTFQTHSPTVAGIKVKRLGKVKRAKLYYLRELSGRAARIGEKVTGKGKVEAQEAAEAEAGAAEEAEAELETAEAPKEPEKVEAPKKPEKKEPEKVEEPKEPKESEKVEAPKEPEKVKEPEIVEEPAKESKKAEEEEPAEKE